MTTIDIPLARTLVVVPTVDEAANIEGLIRKVRAAAPSAHLLVVDGASGDGTGDIVTALAAELGRIDLLVQPTRNGIGGAYRAGFAWGLANGFEVLVEMDADLSHDPQDLPGLISAAAGGARLAIGSRYVPGGSTPSWPARRRLLSRAGNTYVNAMLRLGVRDATAGFRAYRASTLVEIEADRSEANGYAFQVEMAYLVASTGGGIVELPVTFRDRAYGTSKMSGRIVSEAIVLVTRWAIRDRLLHRRRPVLALSNAR